jgi:transposase InsO family protein
VTSQREEFVRLAVDGGVAMAELCRRFEVSRTVGYKWRKRYLEGGAAALDDRSRRPHHSPRETSGEMTDAILALREKHPRWGARKLRRLLLNAGFGRGEVPAASTVNDILARAGLLEASRPAHPGPFERFEDPEPNGTWQMDFKGPLKLPGATVYLLSVLDDHSRFLVALDVCPDQRRETVQERLTRAFRRFGLPNRILVDNGGPWGYTTDHPHTQLTAWLIRQGVHVTHGRPRHPQTQGKVERLHGTIEAEMLLGAHFTGLAAFVRTVAGFRRVYNGERPHHALDLDTPLSHYQPSERRFREPLPAIRYGPDDEVRIVSQLGKINFRGQVFKISKAFVRQPVALRPKDAAGHFAVFFCQQHVVDIEVPMSARNNKGGS